MFIIVKNIIKPVVLYARLVVSPVPPLCEFSTSSENMDACNVQTVPKKGSRAYPTNEKLVKITFSRGLTRLEWIHIYETILSVQ